MVRLTLGFACAVFAAMVIAPAAGASSPASDQYGSALPSGGNGDSSPSGQGGGGSTSGSSSSGDVTIPVGSGSGSTAANTTHSTGNKSTGDRSPGSHKSGGGNGSEAGSPTSHVGSGNSSSHSVPQIASDAAGDGWVPFFIAAMIALAAAAGVLVYRSRRRTAQG